MSTRVRRLLPPRELCLGAPANNASLNSRQGFLIEREHKMADSFSERVQRCTAVPEILDCVLAYSMAVTGTSLGNVQQWNSRTGSLRIAASHGFGREFLETFADVRGEDGSVCGRAMAERSQIIIEDVHADRAFSPYRDIAGRAGFRAVQSTPLISLNGTFVGMISTHFENARQISEPERRELLRAGQIGADAILRAALRSPDRGQFPRSSHSYLALLIRTAGESWRVELPDFPGCIGEAHTAVNALEAACSAAQRLADELSDLGQRWPAPRSLEEIQSDALWSRSRVIWRRAIITSATVIV